VAEEAVDKTRVSTAPKRSTFAILVVGLLFVVGAGAVLVTLRSGSNVGSPSFVESGAAGPASVERDAGAERAAPLPTPTPVSSAESDAASIEEPQEWERELARARRALARGRFDRAYAIANDLPADSVLRETPEFGEIRYRYVQSHIQEGEEAFEKEDFARAVAEAELSLGVPGITAKQRQEARRLLRRTRSRQSRRIVD
jgi:hypothetical protein